MVCPRHYMSGRAEGRRPSHHHAEHICEADTVSARCFHPLTRLCRKEPVMAKGRSNYTPAQMRSISMNPNNKAFYGSRSMPTPSLVPGETKVDQVPTKVKPPASDPPPSKKL